MASRAVFGWSPPHPQPLTPVSEMSEPPESPLPYSIPDVDPGNDDDDDEDDEVEEVAPSAVPFTALFACADGLDWVLMAIGSLAAAAHGATLVLYVHYFGKLLQVLSDGHTRSNDELFEKLCQVFPQTLLLLLTFCNSRSKWLIR